MPNHVANIITIHGDDSTVERIKEFVTNEKGEFDFNKIIPMPERLDIRHDSFGQRGMEYLLGKVDALSLMSEESKKEAIDLGRKYLHNIADYDFPNWYSWRCVKWGTKWNAYDCTSDGNSFTFNTAWHAPLPVFNTLALMFPDAIFDVLFADEDMGANTGHIHYEGSRMETHFPRDLSDDAYAIYIETHPGAEDWLYKDEETGEWKVRED